MEFEEFRKRAIKQIDKQLNQLLKEWRGEVGKIDAKLLPLIDKFISGCYGGKKLRGLLVVLGYEIGRESSVVSRQSSDKDKKSLTAESGAILKADSSIYKIAAAYEIFHSAILVHDDVIDQSLKRRGQPSLHQAIGSGHYGISQAISLGDGGFFLAVKIIAEGYFPVKEKVEAISWFAKTMLDTASGEMLDVAKGDVRSIMILKTARYSVVGPLVLGAILAGGGRDLIRVFRKFGENLGVAFQIQDDILGVFGQEEAMGKSATSDIEEGKNTLLYNYALKRATLLQKQVLAKCYGQGIQGVQGYQSVRQIFEETGALEMVKKEAKDYKERAIKALPQITENLKMSKILQQMAEYLVERKK